MCAYIFGTTHEPSPWFLLMRVLFDDTYLQLSLECRAVKNCLLFFRGKQVRRERVVRSEASVTNTRRVTGTQTTQRVLSCYNLPLSYIHWSFD